MNNMAEKMSAEMPATTRAENIPVEFKESKRVEVPVKEGKIDPRLAEIRGELGAFPAEEIRPNDVVQAQLKELEEACKSYFQESPSIYDARLAREVIETIHATLLRTGMDRAKLAQFEENMVEKYANADGEPEIKYESLWAKIKDVFAEAGDKDKHPAPAIKLSPKEGRIYR